jgi:hypothetical protein
LIFRVPQREAATEVREKHKKPTTETTKDLKVFIAEKGKGKKKSEEKAKQRNNPETNQETKPRTRSDRHQYTQRKQGSTENCGAGIFQDPFLFFKFFFSSSCSDLQVPNN